MLNYMSRGFCALALATTFSATAAQADNHTVLIMDGGFFPAVTYAKPGDNVIFTNNSETAVTLAASDSSWISEGVPVNATHVLNVSHSTYLDFVAVAEVAAVQGDEGEETVEYINLDDVLMEGSLSFNDAPLDSDS